MNRHINRLETSARWLSGKFVIVTMRTTACAVLCAGTVAALDAPALARERCQENELAKITAFEPAAFDIFGQSVAIDEDVAVSGAYEETGAGSAYVYRFGEQGWIEEAKLTASDGVRGDKFGYSVSVSGDVVVVGAPAPAQGGSGFGAAYVYRFDGNKWVAKAKLTASDAAQYDNFGWFVSISGEVAVIGANLDDDAGANSGAVYVFHRPPDGWEDMTETVKLTASDAAEGDEFGRAVSIHEDVLVVGAHYDDDGGGQSGSAYVFRFDGDKWFEEAKLTASDPADQDRFGLSVSVHADVALIGAWADDDGAPGTGSAYVFRFDGEGWEEEAKLTASDAVKGDHFGFSVSVGNDAAVIGAPANLFDGSGFGSAYVFEFVRQDWIEKAKLTASDGEEDDEFARAVSISGATAVVGARHHATGRYANAGAAYTFHGLTDCNENDTMDICDIAEGTSRDDNKNGIPDECEATCAGKEKMRKPKCKDKRGAGKMIVKLKGGLGGDSFEVELSGGQRKDGTLNNNGKGKAKFKKLPSGPGTATATWGCGAKNQKDYNCP